MAAKNKYSETIDPIIRYLNDQMTPEERNEFERNLQRDPFEAEALAGFSILPLKTLFQDLNSFNLLKEGPRIGRVLQRFAVIAGGALVLGLLVYLSILFVPDLIKKIEFKKIRETVSLSGLKKEKPVMTPIDTEVPGFQTIEIIETDTIQGNLSPKDLGSQYIAANKETTLPQVKVPVNKTWKKPPPRIIEPLKPMELNQIDPKKQAQNQQLTLQNQKNETETLDVKEDSPADQDLNQALTDRAPSDKLFSDLDAEPKPIGGEKLFRTYLETNCRYPAGSGKDSKETVRLKFRVSTNGNPHQISITKSPGPEFSNEAIRLIVEGPRWSPAIKDGKPVVGEVSLRINFKP